MSDNRSEASSTTVESLNGDMMRPALMCSSDIAWQPSPSGTVWRKRLHLVGGAETGQVTSIVRYEAGASFPEHPHPEGEEILVLDGIFSDEHGDWPAGTHLLNPEGFRHAPFSRDGCVLFVKLRQYSGEGREHLETNTNEMQWSPTPREGIEEKSLYYDQRFPDVTRLERWAADACWNAATVSGGCEIYLIEGALQDECRNYPAGYWIRVPAGSRLSLISRDGAVLYVKTGAVSSLRTTVEED